MIPQEELLDAAHCSLWGEKKHRTGYTGQVILSLEILQERETFHLQPRLPICAAFSGGIRGALLESSARRRGSKQSCGALKHWHPRKEDSFVRQEAQTAVREGAVCCDEGTVLWSA